MKIEKLSISNFRSLVDFKVEEFDVTTIFYGENNAGKSNILKALEYIFQRKVQYSEGDFTTPINFYEGVIKEFSNNFFNNDKSLVISFSVEVSILKSETEIKGIIKELFKTWPVELKFLIEGNISHSTYADDFAEIQTKVIYVNDILIYRADFNKIEYFPSLKKETGELREAFAYFINPLNDCVFIIGSSRDTHPTQFNSELLENFAPNEFKKSLYSLYLNEKTHTDFEEINSVFSAVPFSFGSISFAKINNELELMIKNDGIRLPIKHLGSGVEQILYIIANLIYKKSKIVCIEELEQNLSPKLQNLALRKIQTLIGKFLDQLIISSHSSVFAKQKLSNSIYLIEKKELITILSEKLNKKFGQKMKRHFIDTALPIDTYTKKDFDEAKKLSEEIFRR